MNKHLWRSMFVLRIFCLLSYSICLIISLNPLHQHLPYSGQAQASQRAEFSVPLNFNIMETRCIKSVWLLNHKLLFSDC